MNDITPPDKQLVEWIAKGVRRDSRLSVHETLEGLLTGRYQLLRYENGIIITRVDQFHRLIVHLIAGSDWLKHKDRCMADLFALADVLGVELIEAYCRPGLEKPLKELGWKREQVVLRVRRNNEQWRRNNQH